MESFSVYCELEPDRNGWTVFQRRFNGSINFDGDFEEYENGFGDIDGEYWLGLRNILRLTRRDRWTLMVDIETNAGDKKYAVYDFKIKFRDSSYNIYVSDYFGTAGNGLQNDLANTKRFYAKDSSYCARQYGAWWHNYSSGSCEANLNSKYHTGMRWGNFQSLKASQMKIRRTL